MTPEEMVQKAEAANKINWGSKSIYWMLHAIYTKLDSTHNLKPLIRLEGMKAENDQRRILGLSPAYTESHFQVLIDELEGKK